MIPKIIHYCWFGKGEMSALLKQCVASWSRLDGYTIMRWDESNCSFNENEFVRRAFKEKRWGFIGDYYRLKAIYDYGGIYLDTDVEVFNDFTPVLSNKVFFGFNYDCCIGTGIIGSAPKQPYIKALMDLYDKTVFLDDSSVERFKISSDGTVFVRGFQTSNYYHTSYVLETYKNFKLNNQTQDMNDFKIYPKEWFEIGKFNKKQYTIHYNTGSWKENKKTHSRFVNAILTFIKQFKGLDYFVSLILRRRRYRKANRRLPFYVCELAQKKGLAIPRLW